MKPTSAEGSSLTTKAVSFSGHVFNQLYDLLVSLNLPLAVVAKILTGNALRLVQV
jgi:hypothetical protein